MVPLYAVPTIYDHRHRILPALKSVLSSAKFPMTLAMTVILGAVILSADWSSSVNYEWMHPTDSDEDRHKVIAKCEMEALGMKSAFRTNDHYDEYMDACLRSYGYLKVKVENSAE